MDGRAARGAGEWKVVEEEEQKVPVARRLEAFEDEVAVIEAVVAVAMAQELVRPPDGPPLLLPQLPRVTAGEAAETAAPAASWTRCF